MPTAIATATIVPQCFRFLEVTPPSSLDDDSDKAQDAAEQYPTALRQCLEAADWSFASVFVMLPPAIIPLPFTSDPDLPYTYTLPGDIVRLQEVGDLGVRWRRDAAALRADDAGPLRVRYTAMVDDETSLPANFRVVVALHLALLLAPRWLVTQSKTQALEARAADLMKLAMRQDARMASEARYDGLPDQGDWAAEATR